MTNEPSKVRLDLPLPAPGGSEIVEFPKHGLTILIQRDNEETAEQKRGRFVVVAPREGNHTHAARLGTGRVKAKKLSTTLCSEQRAEPVPSGTPIPGLTLAGVTCSLCRKKLAGEGVLTVQEETEGS